MTFPGLQSAFNTRAGAGIQSDLLCLPDHVAFHVGLGVKVKYFYPVGVESDSGTVV